MEIEKKNGFLEFIKKYGMYLAVGVVVFVIALTFTLVASLHQSIPASTSTLNFRMPMQNASLIKDFSNTELQNNETLNQWEAHLSVDLTSEISDVFAVLDGTITNVSYSYLEGHTVEIKHSNGFSSIYSSLDENVLVAVGDKVSAGEKIGQAGESASGELDLGNHLCFTMKSKKPRKCDNYLSYFYLHISWFVL